MIENGLELLDYGYGGMLSDGENSVFERVYDYILDNPTKLLNYGACTSGGDSYNDCVVKLGKEICRETNDSELCDLVRKAEVVNDTAKALLSNDFLPDTTPPLPVPQVDISTKLNSLISDFKDIDCGKMSDADKNNLVHRLNNLELSFKTEGRESEFNFLIEKLKCDVVNEFKCGGEDANVVKFETNPRCKKSFVKVWSKPLMYGGATGVSVGFAWHNILKGPVTMSVLVGMIAGGGMTYYIKSRAEKE